MSRADTQKYSRTAVDGSPVPSWLFPVVLLIHIAEEYHGMGLPHGVKLPREYFLALTGATFIAVTAGAVLMRRSAFEERMKLFLATIFFINACSHLVHSVLVGGYNPGLISGMVMFFPLGVYTFRVMKQRMKTPRFVKTVSIGIFIHAIVTIIAK